MGDRYAITAAQGSVYEVEIPFPSNHAGAVEKLLDQHDLSLDDLDGATVQYLDASGRDYEPANLHGRQITLTDDQGNPTEAQWISSRFTSKREMERDRGGDFDMER